MVANKSAEDLIITRVFEAPRELVWKAWTDPSHLMNWWAPKGCTTPFFEVNLRVGGKFHFCMRMPDSREIWGLGTYREIVEPERIAYVNTFADAEGNFVPPSHYGMSADHPSESLVTVTFSEHDGKTTLTLSQSIPGLFAEREGMEKGWSQMLDRLSQELKNDTKGKRS